MDTTNGLFARTLKLSQHGKSEDDFKPAERLLVTRESNGFAVWYWKGAFERIVAWSLHERDAAITYAVKISYEDVLSAAEKNVVNYL